MSRWIIASLVCLLPIGCMSQREYDEMKGQYETQIEMLKTTVAAHERKNGELENQVAFEQSKNRAIGGEADALRVNNAMLMKQIEELNGKMQEFGTEHPDIFETMPGGGLSMKGDASFDAGLATLRPKAIAALDALAAELRNIPNAMIRIDGHTDNDPIVKTKYKWTTASNFELAAARALTVLLHLEKQGIAGSQMHLTSFGEHHPRAANDTKANKAMNRRVEIHVGTMPTSTPIDGVPESVDHK